MKKLTCLMICFAAVVLVSSTEAPAKDGYDVAAFYWPSLHYDKRWAEFFPDGSIGEWESIRNCKPKWQGHWQPRVPAWGYLMDNDPKAMEKKIEAATSHGVNVMIFDWYWFENKPFLESALNDGFLKAKNVGKMKFYLMWANHDAKTAWDIRRSHKMETIWPGSVDLPTFKTVVARVIKKYFSHPSYYKIDGKPVFSIYDMNNLIKGLGGVKQTVEALDYFRAEVKKAGFPDLHFQMIYWGRVPRIDDSGFASAKGTAANTIKTFKVDSITNYQFVHLARPEADYIKWADKALSNWPKWSKNFDVPYFPHVSIGWDNNARFVGKRGAVTDNVNPQTFKKYLLKAKAYADAHPDQQKLITINAWNEWVEGSYLEPDKRFGMGYLKAVKDVFVSGKKQHTKKAAVKKYSDARPAAKMRMNAKDQGIVLRHGDGPDKCDILGAREALIYKENGVYHLFYDGAGPKGWLACLATSKDIVNWQKKGPVLDFGKAGQMDSAAACSPWIHKEGDKWHMFYLGTPNVSPKPNLIPSFPYLTMKASAAKLSGPWIKQKDVIPFRTKPATYYSMTASPGDVVKSGDEYMQFFSSTTQKPGMRCVQRTLGIARTKDLDGSWTVDPKPMVPIEEQVENSSLYYEKSNKTWFLFTNHIGITPGGGEYTDAVWVYWSKDLNKWDPKNKAVVLDGKNCTWSKECIGMPSVIRVGDRLAVFYDAPGGNSLSHMKRNIGLAWLDLPLTVPQE